MIEYGQKLTWSPNIIPPQISAILQSQSGTPKVFWVTGLPSLTVSKVGRWTGRRWTEVFYTAHHAVEPEVSAGIIDKLVQKQVKKDNVQLTDQLVGRRFLQHQNDIGWESIKWFGWKLLRYTPRNLEEHALGLLQKHVWRSFQGLSSTKAASTRTPCFHGNLRVPPQ